MKTKLSLNSLVGKKIASISRLRDDQMLQVIFYDKTMLVLEAVAWSELGEDLPNCGELDWYLDEIVDVEEEK